MLPGGSALLLANLLLLASDVRITQLDGSTQQGALTAITESMLVLEAGGKRTEVPLQNLLLLESDNTSPATPAAEQPPQQFTLRNGSEIAGAAASHSAKEVTLQSPSLGPLTFPVPDVRAIRLQPENPAFRPAWDAFRQRQTEQDLLVVAKRDGSGLDFLAGVVSSAGPEKVDFLIDGETVPVPATRVYGIVFGKPADTTPPIPAVRITLAGSDLLAGSNLTITRNTFKLQLSPESLVQGPAELIRQADFSGGRLRSLPELQPVDIQFLGVEPPNSPVAGIAQQPEFERLLWGPRLDGRIPGVSGHSRLRLRGREFPRGIALHSAAEITWNLEQQFEQLDCLAGIDDAFALSNSGQNAAQLVISIDKRVVLDKLIHGRDEPFPISIPLKDASTLTIKVDYGDGSGVGDWVVLADPKLRIAATAGN